MIIQETRLTSVKGMRHCSTGGGGGSVSLVAVYGIWLRGVLFYFTSPTFNVFLINFNLLSFLFSYNKNNIISIFYINALEILI